MTITRSGMTSKVIKELIVQRVAEALAKYEATRAANDLEAESQSQNSNDGEMVETGMEIIEVMVPGEEDRIKRYIGGLPNNIQWNVMSAEPTRLYDAIQLANSLMDQKLKGYAIRSAKNKRKFGRNQRDNHAQQPCSIGKMLEDQMWPEPIRLVVMKEGFILDLTLFATSASYIMMGHRLQWNFKKDCPKLKNQNHGNKHVILEARGKAYAIGRGDANPGSNVVM
nr:hypothetical protein [Tanacetum cinerariifolium]